MAGVGRERGGGKIERQLYLNNNKKMWKKLKFKKSSKVLRKFFIYSKRFSTSMWNILRTLKVFLKQCPVI